MDEEYSAADGRAETLSFLCCSGVQAQPTMEVLPPRDWFGQDRPT